MSFGPNSIPASSNLENIINTALTKYSSQTGKDLRNHPLATEIDACNSAESILKVFRDQAREFEDSRNGDRKLIECLEPLVINLYAISTSPIFSTVVGPVRPGQFLFVTTSFNAVVV